MTPPPLPHPPPGPHRVRAQRSVPRVASGEADPTGSTPVARRRRDRRGRGLRGPLLSGRVPLSRTRSQRFDDVVLQAVDDLVEIFGDQLSSLEFAVDEVPPVAAGRQAAEVVDAVSDGGVPLTRFVPPGVDRRGRPTRARVIVYRRPIEHRATDPDDLEELIADLLHEQVAAILGEPD